MQGLRETRHPYTFVSIEGFKDLLTASNAAAKASPLLNKMAPSLRAALNSKDSGAFDRGLTALAHLSDCVGPSLDSVLKVDSFRSHRHLILFLIFNHYFYLK